jgi:hypothetical protein
MNDRVYKLVDTYLSEILFDGLRKIESKFYGGDVSCWKSKDDIVIMIEGNYIKLSGKIWYILTNHFGLNAHEVYMVIVGWIRNNLHIYKSLTMGDCSYTRST